MIDILTQGDKVIYDNTFNLNKWTLNLNLKVYESNKSVCTTYRFERFMSPYSFMKKLHKYVLKTDMYKPKVLYDTKYLYQSNEEIVLNVNKSNSNYVINTFRLPYFMRENDFVMKCNIRNDGYLHCIIKLSVYEAFDNETNMKTIIDKNIYTVVEFDNNIMRD